MVDIGTDYIAPFCSHCLQKVLVDMLVWLCFYVSIFVCSVDATELTTSAMLLGKGKVESIFNRETS
jgi:hypothetical protein